jgi:hypothetical protein
MIDARAPSVVSDEEDLMPTTPKYAEERDLVSSIGALLSDLVAHTHAFSTEDERGALLAQRVAEIRTTCVTLTTKVEQAARLRA